MGIASGIFWIVLGLLYIVYRAFSEYATETFAVLLFTGLFAGVLIAWEAILEVLFSWNVTVALAFVFLSILSIVAFCLRLLCRGEKERTAPENADGAQQGQEEGL